MSEFKTGDKVMGLLGGSYWVSGEITDISCSKRLYLFKADDGGGEWWCRANNIKRATDSKLVERVNHPNHYNHGKVETIDVIATALVGYKNSLVSYDLGSVIKYIARAPFKGELLEDLKKARWYLDHAIKTLEQREKVKSMGDKADEAVNSAIKKV